jgi:hypothetical protein
LKRTAEDRHDRIANELVHGAVVTEHRFREALAIIRKEGTKLVRSHGLSQSREAADVNEEDCRGLPPAG